MIKLFILMMFIPMTGFSQRILSGEISASDSLKEVCNKFFISEIGEKMFSSCITFDSISGNKRSYKSGETRYDYTFYYSFSFPGVKEAKTTLTLNYAFYSGNGHWQSARFLRFNQTDLPLNLIKKGSQILSIEKVRDIAIKANSLMKNANCSFVLGQNSFYWHFITYQQDADKEGDMEKIISYNVIVDPFTGKIIANFKE